MHGGYFASLYFVFVCFVNTMAHTKEKEQNIIAFKFKIKGNATVNGTRDKEK